MGKEYNRLYTLTCLFNFYAQYIKRNTRLDESQAGIKIFGRIINNFKYTDDATWIAASEEELKHILMKVYEESKKAGLKLNIKKKKKKIKPGEFKKIQRAALPTAPQPHSTPLHLSHSPPPAFFYFGLQTWASLISKKNFPQ